MADPVTMMAVGGFAMQGVSSIAGGHAKAQEARDSAVQAQYGAINSEINARNVELAKRNARTDAQITESRADYARLQARLSEQEATVAEVAADQADTQLREELRTTIGTIATIRAGANVGESATEQAIVAEQERVSGRESRTQRFNAQQVAARARQDAMGFKSEAINQDIDALRIREGLPYYDESAALHRTQAQFYRDQVTLRRQAAKTALIGGYAGALGSFAKAGVEIYNA